MKILFVINNIDFTERINDLKYKMRRKEIYREWQDGNFTTHRARLRNVVQGDFVMTFYNEADYDAFNDAVNAATDAEGISTMTVFLDKEKINVTINGFIDYDTRIVWTSEAFGSLPAVAEVAVSIIER